MILSHNRKIRLRADDSVMDWLEGKPYMIRRSRGYAPLPFMLSGDFSGQVLGIGGELKNTFCVAKNGLFYLSPYVGDMADVRTVNALRESVTRLETLLERGQLAGIRKHLVHGVAVTPERVTGINNYLMRTVAEYPSWVRASARAWARTRRSVPASRTTGA